MLYLEHPDFVEDYEKLLTHRPLKPLPPDADLDWPSFWLAYRSTCNAQQLNTIAKQDIALKLYQQVGTLKAGVEALGMTYEAAMQWRERDVHYFRRRLALAQEVHADHLEEIMHERLVDPTGNRGSDLLLMFNLKAKRPEIYREAILLGATDASRDLLAGLANMMARQIAAQQGQKAIPETIEGKVVRVLNPGKPTDDTPGTELP